MSHVPPLPALAASDRLVDEAIGAMQLATAVVVGRLRGGRPTELRVSGYSMWPFLTPGQSVLLEPCVAASLRRGNLVAFECDGRVILHRVLAVDPGTGLVTAKGDHVHQAELVPAGQVIGQATAVLSPRHVSLLPTRYALTGRWLARVSMLHAGLHRFAERHRITGMLPARISSVTLRLAAAFFRPPR